MTNRVLVTGISGFLGGHVALQLLKAGHAVRGSVRNLDRAETVKAALARAGAPVDQLEFVALDLLQDDGWDKALEDIRYLQHVASPYVTTMPADKMDLIRPAVEGTERALNAALKSGVEHIVLTSSMVAIMHGHGPNHTKPFTGADWSRIGAPDLNAYGESKVLAEQKAWEIMHAAGRGDALSVVNPSAILGPLLDNDPGTSGQLFLRILKGEIPAAPRFHLPSIDVRDVAAVHVAAMTAPEARGQRLPVSDTTLSIKQVADIIATAFPAYAGKMPKFEMPNWLVRIYALFDADVRGNLGSLGHRPQIDATAARTLIGRDFIPAKEATITLAASLIENKLA